MNKFLEGTFIYIHLDWPLCWTNEGLAFKK